MLDFLINTIKIVILLGTLVFIHELGHFTFAKLFKIKVNEFALGFGPLIYKKQGKETKYALRLIPFGGFISMEGEEERSKSKGSYSEASIFKRICIVAAGGIVNILFALIIYIGLVWYYNDLFFALASIDDFFISIFVSLKMIFTGGTTVEQMMGPVGISSVVANTTTITDMLYIMSLISLSLGVTNLLPFPPLDGGKVVLLIIEAIRKKPLKENVEMYIQLAGFILLISLSIFVTYNDIIRLIQ